MANMEELLNKAGFATTENTKKQNRDNKKNNKNNINGNKSNSNANTNTSEYVGAPYNFVPISEKVIAKCETDMTVRGELNKDLLSGEISYKFTAQTSIFISNGKADADFVTNERGQYIIPGSSVRGLIRNNVQILGLSSIDDDIDDYSLMYRKVGSKMSSDKERYEEILGAKTIAIPRRKTGISVLLNVKAGYIAKKENKYVIYQTKVDSIESKYKEMNYYVLSERTIADNLKDYPYFDKHPECLQNKVKKGFKKDTTKRPVQYKGIPNDKYTPGYYDISYEIKDLKNVVQINEPKMASKAGVLMCTGFMNNKKALYVIPEIDINNKIVIPDEDVTVFKIDYEKKKNTLKGNKYNEHNIDAFNLPEDGEVKPVFYIHLDGRLYFGFTPRLRLFYDHSIKDGLKQDKVDFDYAKSMFGTIKDKVGYKSKLAFTDAVTCGTPTKEQEEEMVLAEPKPSSCLDYLVQNQSQPSTYNSPDIKIRGIKQYWLRANLVQNSEKVNKNVKTVLKPLAKGTEFTGTIRFNNLTRDELGLLVWSIKLEEHSMMNIGMGKPYGFGVISVSDVKVKTVCNDKAYSLDKVLDFNPFEEIDDVDKLIGEYKETVNEQLDGKKIDELPSIQNFFLIKDSEKKPKNDKIRYMSINDKEYQNRTKPLQTIKELTKRD